MKKISSEEVTADLVFALGGFSIDEYDSAIQIIKKMTKKEKMNKSGQTEFPKTWNELFEDETEWYKTKLPASTEFVNKIFDSGKGFMTYIGQKHSDLMNEYKTKKMSKKNIKIIDKIRKNLKEKPRIIVITKDYKNYTIFDGAHRAIAFALENKKIPVYLGFRKKFSALKYM